MIYFANNIAKWQNASTLRLKKMLPLTNSNDVIRAFIVSFW